MQVEHTPQVSHTGYGDSMSTVQKKGKITFYILIFF